MWQCKRCGDCCKLIGDTDEWKNVQLGLRKQETIERFTRLDVRGCEALVKTNGNHSCLNQLLYGHDAKPKGCQDFSRGRCQMTARIKQLLIMRESNETNISNTAGLLSAGFATG